MTDAGVLIKGRQAAEALKGKSDHEVIVAYDGWLDAQSAGSLQNIPPIVSPEGQLQSKFKHADDFGVNGNYNEANKAEFEKAIRGHIGDADTQYINGRYRGQAADIFYNPKTGNAIIADKSGNFVSGWRLSADQIANLLSHGNLQ